MITEVSGVRMMPANAVPIPTSAYAPGPPVVPGARRIPAEHGSVVRSGSIGRVQVIGRRSPNGMSQNQTGGVLPEGISMADNKTDSRQWTSEKPTKSGFYYYRQSNDEEPIVLRVEVLDDRKGLNSVVWLPGDNAAEPLEQCHGDWAGPIEPPA